MKKRMIPAALLLLSAAAPAFSQSLSALPLRNPHQIPDGYISVQSGISLSIPITDGNDEKQQQDAIKSFYRIAASNCTVLLDTIADDCQINGLFQQYRCHQHRRPRAEADSARPSHYGGKAEASRQRLEVKKVRRSADN